MNDKQTISVIDFAEISAKNEGDKRLILSIFSNQLSSGGERLCKTQTVMFYWITIIGYSIRFSSKSSSTEKVTLCPYQELTQTVI